MKEAEAFGPRIVVGVDGSAPSRAALRWAVEYARLAGGSVEAITAWNYPPAWHGWSPPVADAFTAEDARTILDDAISDALGTDRPVPLSTRVERGDAAPALLSVAEKAALLVVGNRGHGRFAGALLGSVSQHCVAHAACPVVVVRGADERAVAGTASDSRNAPLTEMQ